MPNNSHRLHTHRETIGIDSSATNTEYLTPAHARALARELIAFANDLDQGKFRCTRLVIGDKRMNECNEKRKPIYI